MTEQKVHEVNGHIESTYSKATDMWTPLKFVTSPYVHIHGMASGLNYGQQALEGFKAFRMPGSPSDIALFRPDRNAMRFQHSVEVTRPSLGLYPPVEFTFRVFVVPTGVYYGTEPLNALILDDFDRAAPKGVGHAKVGANYAPVMRWSERARTGGFGITLHLDSARREHVDEFGTCAFIGVRSHEGADHVTLVFADSPCVIDSITSDSLQHIARHYGWKVEKRPVQYTELPTLDEVLGAGTSVALVPIRSITRRRTTGQLPASQRVLVDAEFKTISYLPDEQHNGGPVYLRLLARLRAIQMGKVQGEFGWRFMVREEDQDVDGGMITSCERCDRLE
ncbi:MAG: hypothetical protein Q9195_006639 [Heterodermia aff. obscurata]